MRCASCLSPFRCTAPTAPGEGLTPPDVALLSRVVASVDTSEPALSLIVRILTGDLPEE